MTDTTSTPLSEQEEISSSSEATSEEQGSIVSEQSTTEAESTVKEQSDTAEKESAAQETDSCESESSTSERGGDDTESASRKTDTFSDVEVENDLTVAGTLRVKNLVTPMADEPEKDGKGFYSSGAAYKHNATHIGVDDSTQASDGMVGLTLRNADDEALGEIAKIFTGLTSKDKQSISESAGQLKDYIDNAIAALATKYLRKDQDDTSTHKLTLGGLQIKGQTTFGEFSGGELTGQGGRIDELGNAILQSLTVRGRLKVTELIRNRLSLVEADYNFTENGTIESVTKVNENSYRLVMRKRWDGDTTAFALNDVCYGSVNNIADETTTTKEVNTCWFKVESVDTDTNTLLISVYPDNEVPDQKNSVPVADMVVARRGNSSNEERQSSWYLSSSEGGIVLLRGVTKPIINKTNYSGFIGLSKILQGLYPDVNIPSNDFVLYGDTVYAHQFISINKDGEPVYEKRDCGRWTKGRTYYKGLDPTDNTYHQDYCWYGGIFWQCDNTHTAVNPPRWNNTDWTAVMGDENWGIDFVSSVGNTVNINGDMNISLEARIWQSSMQLFCQAQSPDEYDIETTEVWWTRESKRPDGTDIDASGDLAWNAEHKQTTWTGGLVLTLARADFPSTFIAGNRVGFRVHAIVNSVEKTGVYNLN